MTDLFDAGPMRPPPTARTGRPLTADHRRMIVVAALP